tara:strand:- start:208 stop:804 length:597 start_codon:yes stop_codon:yes gene_type:complete
MLIIGICGGSGSGKTTLANNLKKYFGSKRMAYIGCDSYYKKNNHLSLKKRSKLNFDHPDLIDFELLVDNLNSLKNLEKINIPKYSYKTHKRLKTKRTLSPRNLIVLEGLHILHDNRILNLINYCIFLDLDYKLRLKRRIKRDIMLRNRNKEDIISRFLQMSEPMYKKYVKPKKTKADLILKCKKINIKKIITLINTFS